MNRPPVHSGSARVWNFRRYISHSPLLEPCAGPAVTTGLGRGTRYITTEAIMSFVELHTSDPCICELENKVTLELQHRRPT